MVEVLGDEAVAQYGSKRPYVWQRTGAAERVERLGALSRMHCTQQLQVAVALAGDVTSSSGRRLRRRGRAVALHLQLPTVRGAPAETGSN